MDEGVKLGGGEEGRSGLSRIHSRFLIRKHYLILVDVGEMIPHLKNRFYVHTMRITQWVGKIGMTSFLHSVSSETADEHK